MDAQGALDSLLGRLTTILVDEARLLGGLQGDVEFINDEMESMNGLILHLTEAHHRDHQVRAWMKQVVGLARDCEGNVELYIHSVTDAGHHDSGFLGYLGRIVRYLRTIPERRRIATRIRELKVRARDVGDRKLRYDVTVPPAAADQDDAIFMGDIQASHGSEDEDEDLRRRALLVNCPDDQQPYVQKTIDDIIKSLLPQEGPVVELSQGESQLKIFLLTWDEYRSYGSACGVDHSYTKLISRKLYEQKMSSFSCKAFVTMNSYSYMEVQGIKYAHPECKSLVQILREILHQVAPILVEQDVLMVEAEKDMETSLLGDGKEDEATQLIKKLEGFLKGKQLLIIFQDVYSKEDWNSISSAMLHATARGSPGSAIVITTKSADLIDLESPSPYKIFKLRSPFHAFYNKTVELAKCSGRSLAVGIGDILGLCYTDFFAMKMVLHLLYVNPRRGITQVDNIVAALNGCLASNRSVGKQMVKISYNELPTKYRSCLLSLTIFPEGDRIRRTTMCRRWIAEGLITSKENRAEDEADCCFEALFSWGLILPVEVNEMGKMKACTLHPVVREVITRIARDLNFVDTDLPTHLARHLPVHNRTGAQASHTDRCVQADNDNGIVAFLPYLAKSSQWQLMKILDLESCRGLKKQHLKSICKIILLKYLSLRNTDITELPKQIEKLQCLETLDIRETEVQAFATRSIMLPMLKHLLSGQTKSPSNIFDSSQDFRTAVRLPSGIRRMARLEILSHVDASHSVNDLTDVGHLLQLRKLGVILRGKKCGLGLLFLQIENLHGCIRSLSIQIYQPVSKTEDVSCAEEVVTLASPPKLLQSLKISGIRSGLLIWIAELDQLTKITLSETYLAEDYMRILGKLRALRCLRLRRNSYAGSRLTFKEEEFENLKSLAVDDGTITGITFDSKAAPKLETIVWSFAKMEYISGLLCLPKLKNVELNGDCDSDPVRQELEEHTNYPEFKHKPRHGQEDGVVVALSPP